MKVSVQYPRIHVKKMLDMVHTVISATVLVETGRSVEFTSHWPGLISKPEPK